MGPTAVHLGRRNERIHNLPGGMQRSLLSVAICKTTSDFSPGLPVFQVGPIGLLLRIMGHLVAVVESIQRIAIHRRPIGSANF